MRLLHSFLISLNIHIWVVLLLSLVFVASKPDPQPKRIEIQFLKLPAPQEGESAAVSGLYLPRATAYSRSNLEVAIRPDRPKKHLRRKRGPQVEYRVRVARSSPAVAVRDAGTWSPASSVVFQRSFDHAPGSRISGTSPEAPRSQQSAASVPPVRKSPTADNRPLTTYNRSPAAEQVSWSPTEAAPGGDTRPLLDVIQARIDAVTPLVHASAGPCQTERGLVRLKFVVNQAGYPCGFRIVASSGVRCLDDEVDNVLHMAEPYPYVAGWIPVTVRFAPRTRI